MLVRLVVVLAAVTISLLLFAHSSGARTRLARHDDRAQAVARQPGTVTHFGVSPWDPPLEPSSKRIVLDQGPGLDQGCHYASQGKITIEFYVTRAVGDVATLKAQGLISPFAQLYMPVYDVDFAYGERDRVKVNDTVTEGEYLSGENDEWTYWSTAVPIEALRFPAVTGNLSEPVVPVLNKIEIEVDTTGEGWCTDVDWFLLSFDVASPVVMAHGLGDSPNAFASSYETYLRDTCGLPVHNVDFRVNGVANSTIATNSEKLAAEIASVRAHLGVEQVSLLTHSMGGIVARHYTESHDDVDHVIQCGTPNVGSPVADFTWKLLLALYSVEDYTINFHDKYPEIQKFEGPGLLQMTTNYMGYVYNYAHGRKAKVKFSAIAGEQPHPSNDCPTTDVIKGSRAGSVIISGATLDVNDCVVTRMSAHGIPDPLWVGAAGFRVDNTAWVFDSSCNLHATHEYLVALAPVPPPLDEEQRHPVTYPIVLDWLRPPVFPERPAAREQASSVARSPRPKSTAFNATDGNVPNGAQSTAGDGAELLVLKQANKLNMSAGVEATLASRSLAASCRRECGLGAV